MDGLDIITKLKEKTIVLNRRIKYLVLWLLSAAIIFGCQPSQDRGDIPVLVNDQSSEPISKKPTSDDLSQPNKAGSAPGFELPGNLAPITPSNVGEVALLGEILPQSPPFYTISPDGRRTAIGTMGKIEIRETASGDLISTINVDLPDCSFGFRKYFSFNQDGSFLAIASADSIQLWQTSGGLIYKNNLNRNFNAASPSCGSDIPQFALSPDGMVLAVSGIEYSGTAIEQYFRVIDVIANEIIYEWDGSEDDLHGNFYVHPGLGFSSDGRQLQTFDPVRFIFAEGDHHRAFRFWSAENWEEVEVSAKKAGSYFNDGSMLFAVSNSGKISIINKQDGSEMASIPVPGCVWDAPCEMRFSSDGRKAAILPRQGEMIQFRQSLLYPSVQVWDLENRKMINEISGNFRSMDGLFPDEDGNLISIKLDDIALSNQSGWWVFSDLFQGILEDIEGRVFFVPTQSGIESDRGCRYCDTCMLDNENGIVNCFNGVISAISGNYSVDLSGGRYWLVKNDPMESGPVGMMSGMLKEGGEEQRIRLLGYSDEFHTAFYCLDMNFRPERCAIDLIGESRILKELSDIAYLRFSQNGNTAAFINTVENALYVYNLETQRLSRKSHFQARAAKTNPVFSTDGEKLYYLVENLNHSGEYAMEIMDATSQKVFRRVSFAKIDLGFPKAIEISDDENLWVIANGEGDIYFVSPEKGILLGDKASVHNNLIGVTFTQNMELLVTLDSFGRLDYWGIQE